MRKLLALILALSMPINSHAAECQVPVKLLEEGTPAPCRGFLFSPETELKARISAKDNILLKEEIESLNSMLDRLDKKNQESEKIIDLEIQKSELWKSRAEDITLKYVQVEENRTKRDALFIVLGIGLTVLSGWALGQVARN